MKERKIKILFADDCFVHQKLFKIIIEKFECFEVDYANNGMELIDMALKNEYEIIFVDINMPILNGDEAVFELRNKYGYKKTIIGVTAEISNKIAKINALFDKLISKPYNNNEIIRILNYVRSNNNL